MTVVYNTTSARLDVDTAYYIDLIINPLRRIMPVSAQTTEAYYDITTVHCKMKVFEGLSEVLK